MKPRRTDYIKKSSRKSTQSLHKNNKISGRKRLTSINSNDSERSSKSSRRKSKVNAKKHNKKSNEESQNKYSKYPHKQRLSEYIDSKVRDKSKHSRMANATLNNIKTKRAQTKH